MLKPEIASAGTVKNLLAKTYKVHKFPSIFPVLGYSLAKHHNMMDIFVSE